MRVADRRWAGVACPGVLAFALLTGCAQPPVTVPTTPAATDAPVFASEEEALAAATDAYAAYLKASDDSWAGGSTTREEFLALSTGQAHDDDVAADALFTERGWKKTGVTSFDSMLLQSSGPSGGGEWEIRAYVCVDVTQSDVIDNSGQSVAKKDRPLRMPLLVAFVPSQNNSSILRVSESTTWSGSNFC
jgi:hypothetical protein